MVCDYKGLYMFSLGGRDNLVERARLHTVTFPMSGIESCCFDGEDVVLVSENGDIYRVPQDAIQANARYAKKPAAPTPSSAE